MSESPSVVDKSKSLCERVTEALNNWVLIEWEYAKETFDRLNILRPPKYREAFFTGIVVKVGKRCRGWQTGEYEFKPGDRVFWDQFASPHKFEENGKRYAWIREHYVYAIIPPRAEFSSAPLPADLFEEPKKTRMYSFG